MSKWDDLDKRAKEMMGDGNFVQLKQDKDTVVGAFVGEPEARELFWDQAKNKYEPYTEEHAKEKKQVTLRVLLNFLVIKEGNDDDLKDLDPPKCKVLELNATTFRQVVKARKKYGFEKKYFEIQRNGAKGDTNTTYSVMVDDDIEAEDQATLKDVKLHDLKKLIQGKDSGGSGGDFDSYDKSKKEDPDAAISKDDVSELIGKLKPRPREDLDKFLSRFEIKQIKQLKAGQLETARAFLADLDGGGKAEEKEEAEDDPFAD